MAVVRARSAPPYALITFVTLWVISTVLAVLFYLQATQADQALQKAQREIDPIASAAERSSRESPGAKILLDSPDKKNQSQLQAAFSELQALKKLIAGDPGAPLANVIATAQSALDKAGPNNQGLVAALTAALSARDTATNQLAAANASLKSINDTIMANGINNSQETSAMDTKFADLSKERDTLQAQLQQARAEVVAANENAQKLITEAADKAEQQHRDDVIAMQALNAQINKNLSEISVFKQRLANITPSDKPYVGEPDGQIVRVNPGAGEAYINLNRPRDRMTAGMTFAVYDPRTGVRFGSDEDAMGKGSIEVIEPGEVNSLVRITRVTKGMTITEGDLIANQVYQANKNRQYHFVVFGDFDLDGDGIATAHERERLDQLIVAWGGVIDTEVTAQTDYVVVGARPKSPLINTEEVPATGSAASQRASVQDAYDSLITEAKRLSVPVLNANRFLSMIGYYSTTIVRH